MKKPKGSNIILKLITNCLIYQSYFEETARFVGIDKDGNTRGAYKMARKYQWFQLAFHHLALNSKQFRLQSFFVF